LETEEIENIEECPTEENRGTKRNEDSFTAEQVYKDQE
jgi:hypothetical protein